MRSYEGYLEERYVEIVRALVAAIREVDPHRLIVCRRYQHRPAPVMGIADLVCPKYARLFAKGGESYTANWVPKMIRELQYSDVAVQGRLKEKVWDRARLKSETSKHINHW